MTLDCQLCGRVLRGPVYEREQDRLRFFCTCGHIEYCAPLEAEPVYARDNPYAVQRVALERR